MPFYCANELPASASFSTRKHPQRIPSGSERVLARLGRADVIAYASDFSEPAASHPPASLFPRNEG
jgi:hypothetical protein